MTGNGARRPAVFLDRDGTLIDDVGYLRDPARVMLLGGVADALRAIEATGYLRLVITNQSGIGRGLIAPAQYEATRVELDRQLHDAGASVDATLHCPHAPDAGCTCRKPGTALHREAAARFDVDLERSWCIGDHLRDLQPAAELGTRAMLLDRAPELAVRAAAEGLGAVIRSGLGAGLADLPRYPCVL